MIQEAPKHAYVSGSYNIRIQFSTIEKDILVDPSSIKELTIVQDLYSFLPSLRMAIPSAGEHYTLISPFDQTARISIDFGYGPDITEGGNSFDFLVYRRFPRSTDQIIDVEGLLDIGNLFDRQHTRAFSGQVSDSLRTIANELKIQENVKKSQGQTKVNALISNTLDFQKTILQCMQTNASLLTYLQFNIEGRGNEGAYYCNLYNESGTTYFRFTTLEELTKEPIKMNLAFGTSGFPQEEETDNYTPYRPVWSYDLVENYKAETISGALKSEYLYFDYEEGELKKNSTTVDEFNSLTNYFLIQNDDPDYSFNTLTGRTNDFTSSFLGRAKSDYQRRLINLVRLKVTSFGMANIIPGDIVSLIFIQPIIPEHQMDILYQGDWMVEKVTHSFLMEYTTTLILVRNGVNTTQDTKLKKAVRKR